MNKEFIEAINQIEKEKGVSKELLFDAIESALMSAYKKNYGVEGNVEVKIDREEGEINVITKMSVVEEVEDSTREMTIEAAQEIDPAYEIGDEVAFQVTPKDFGRIAAQTAKQVVVQRIREAERGMIFDDYIDRIGEVATGTVQRKSGDTFYINMGKIEGILSGKEQVKGENFKAKDRVKVYIMDVKNSSKGPQVFLSRSHPGLVKKLFEREVPEIEEGIVEIKSIAREAGSRTKLAVYTADENVDPVGACVGSKGIRVQNIVDDLFNEKIDIITWSEDPEVLINNVLSPAKVEKVIIDEEERMATVIVPDYQLSLAIGKSGQNVRLAAKLCGWKIDIKSHTQYFGEDEDEITMMDEDNGDIEVEELQDEIVEVEEEVIETDKENMEVSRDDEDNGEDSLETDTDDENKEESKEEEIVEIEE